MFSYQDYLEERHYNVLKESISSAEYDTLGARPTSIQISSSRYDTPGMKISDQFCQVRHSGYDDTSESVLPGMALRVWRYISISFAENGNPRMEQSSRMNKPRMAIQEWSRVRE